ncbi:MAG: SDR family oxidoreductase, partial [Deferrisomatales bacterium]
MSDLNGSWALILGASSGFGAAAARTLARKGMNIAGVHLDRKATMPQVEALAGELEAAGVQVRFFNVNAADPEKRRDVLDELRQAAGDGPKVRVLMHSLAFGALKPYLADPGQAMTQPQMDMTLDVMAHSLVYWVQDVV